MIRNWLMALVFVFSVVQAHAGDSGCGLGSLIISKNSKLLQLFSITTNWSFFSQPFGITSGTSGCNASGIVMNEKAVQYYAEVNQEDLSREMAQGQGEKLTALAALCGCRGEDQQQFAKMTQSKYQQIYAKPDQPATELVQNLRVELANHPELETCRL